MKGQMNVKTAPLKVQGNKNFDGATRKAITDFMRKRPYRLLCTATAAPNDYVELGTSAEALGEAQSEDLIRLLAYHAESAGVEARLGLLDGGHIGRVAGEDFVTQRHPAPRDPGPRRSPQGRRRGLHRRQVGAQRARRPRHHRHRSDPARQGGRAADQHVLRVLQPRLQPLRTM